MKRTRGNYKRKFLYKKSQIMKTFIFILDTRVRLAMIKKYKSNGERSITVYYSLASKNPAFEVFVFEDTDSRDEVLEQLDNILL